MFLETGVNPNLIWRWGMVPVHQPLSTHLCIMFNSATRSFRRKLLASILALSFLFAGSGLNAQCNQLYDWATWNNFSGNSATGTIMFNGQPINVTMTANYTFDSTPNIYNYPAFGGFNGPLPPDATVPRTTWAAGQGGETEMCFSETVTNPALLLSSVGNPGLAVTLTFSHPYIVIYDGGGMTFPNDMTIIGQEGYAIIVFPGDLDCVTIYSDTPENYTNITWGLNPPLFEVEIEGDTIGCGSVTLTATGGVSYEWSGGEDPNSGTNTFTETGTYLLTVTDDDGCTVVTSVNVEVYPAGESEMEAAICEGDGYDFFGQYLTQPGQYEETIQNEFGCDSTITLTLEVNYISTEEQYEEICEGDIYFFNGDSYDKTGSYTATLENVFGCDSLVTLHLVVHDLNYTEINEEICEGEYVEFDGVQLTTQGSYYAFLLNEFNCDSTVLLTLVVNEASYTNLNASICSGESYAFDGKMLNTAGNYEAIYSNGFGCDSTVTLNLVVHQANASALSASICAGASYLFHGDTLTQAGDYTTLLQNQYGCDSTVTLSLGINPHSTSAVNASICSGEIYNFNGVPYTASGLYTDTLQNLWGCDSVITLTLTAHANASTNIDVQICEGQTYTFQGTQISNAGTYTADLQTINGCDSTVTLSLSVVDVIEAALDIALCNGESYSFGGNALSASGMYIDTLLSTGGCDSITTLQLTVNNATSSGETATICEGETYLFNGQSLTTAGQFVANLQNANGCDSLVTLTLGVTPITTTPLNVQLCAGESYLFDGDILNTPGQYTANLQGVAGCDSTVILTLSVVSSKETDLTGSICQGSNYIFGGNNLTQGGVYLDTLITASGCDSIVTLSLVINPIITDSMSVSICDGEAFSFNGTLLTASGVYTADLQTVSGCDSNLILRLEVDEAFSLDEIVMHCDSFYWPLNNTTYFQSGVYTLANNTINGCDSIHRLLLTIHPSYAFQESVSAIRKYTWPVNQETYVQSGTYVENLISVNGCDSMMTLDLVIIRKDNLYIPNAFSPNYDGINDKFTIYGDESLVLIESLRIYDRWGNYLSSFSDLPPNNPEYGWDGKSDGKTLDPGVYVYTALLRFDNEESKLYSGEVIIVK